MLAGRVVPLSGQRMPRRRQPQHQQVRVLPLDAPAQNAPCARWRAIAGTNTHRIVSHEDFGRSNINGYCEGRLAAPLITK